MKILISILLLSPIVSMAKPVSLSTIEYVIQDAVEQVLTNGSPEIDRDLIYISKMVEKKNVATMEFEVGVNSEDTYYVCKGEVKFSSAVQDAMTSATQSKLTCSEETRPEDEEIYVPE